LSNQRTELINAFGAVGGDAAAMFQNRSQKLKEREMRERERREGSEERRGGKRPLDDRSAASNEKRQRLGQEGGSADRLAGFDFNSLPLPMVTEFCLAILQNTSIETITGRLPLVHQALNNGPNGPGTPVKSESTHMATPPQIVSARSPDMRGVKIEGREVSTPNSQSQTPEPDSVKSEVSEYKTITAVGRNPLPSTQERVLQSFKMQPYALAAPPEFAKRQKMEMLKLAVQRILEAEKLSLQALPIVDPNEEEEGSGQRQAAITFNSPLKATWTLLVSKLIANSTRATKKAANDNDEEQPDSKMDVDELDDDDPSSLEVDELRDMLLEFIIENLPQR
jgi:hypothetical protein